MERFEYLADWEAALAEDSYRFPRVWEPAPVRDRVYVATVGCAELRHAEAVVKPTIRRGKFATPEYIAWNNMRGRCNSPSTPEWKNYGARGIRICARWDSFDLFLSDMGPRPSSRHSLDRINNDGNYEPGNCRWATVAEQNTNKRPNNGERNPQARLTDDQVVAMRAARRHGRSFRDLGEQFKVSTMASYRATTGQSWAHLPGATQ